MSIFCDIDKDLDFLGPGYKLYFIFIKYSAYLMIIMLLGIGIFDCYVNY